MSADHRKPVVAFIVLACLAAALICIQRADARGAQFLASLPGITDRVRGSVGHTGQWSVRDDQRPVAGQGRPAGSAETVAGDRSVPSSRAVEPRTRDDAEGRRARGLGAHSGHREGKPVTAALPPSASREAARGRSLRTTRVPEKSFGQVRRNAVPGLAEKAHRKVAAERGRVARTTTPQ